MLWVHNDREAYIHQDSHLDGIFSKCDPENWNRLHWCIYDWANLIISSNLALIDKIKRFKCIPEIRWQLFRPQRQGKSMAADALVSNGVSSFRFRCRIQRKRAHSSLARLHYYFWHDLENINIQQFKYTRIHIFFSFFMILTNELD